MFTASLFKSVEKTETTKCPLISDHRKLLSNKKEQAFNLCPNLDGAQSKRAPSRSLPTA